jgi:sugar lactone lactonase YvrE
VELGRISLDETHGVSQVTNVAFGDADRMTLYITSLGFSPRLYSVRLNVPGFVY